jgi:hypothetical protein
VAVVLSGGQVVFGILDRGDQAIVGVGVGRFRDSKTPCSFEVLADCLSANPPYQSSTLPGWGARLRNASGTV